MDHSWSATGLFRQVCFVVGASVALAVAGIAWDVYRLPAQDRVGTTLQRLFASDQAARYAGAGEPLSVGRFWVGDWIRLTKARRIADAGLLRSGEDHYMAAFIMQHGLSAADFALARELATKAADLGHPRGRRLAAAAEDRYLVKLGHPQKYGTQFRCSAGRGWHLDPVDSTVTDAARAALGIESLASAEARMRRLNDALDGRCRLDADGMRVFARITNEAGSA